jgi:hypothetical protein
MLRVATDKDADNGFELLLLLLLVWWLLMLPKSMSKAGFIEGRRHKSWLNITTTTPAFIRVVKEKKQQIIQRLQ